jgi:hypothetical protein
MMGKVVAMRQIVSHSVPLATRCCPARQARTPRLLACSRLHSFVDSSLTATHNCPSSPRLPVQLHQPIPRMTASDVVNSVVDSMKAKIRSPTAEPTVS